jgi:hypothetical protein
VDAYNHFLEAKQTKKKTQNLNRDDTLKCSTAKLTSMIQCEDTNTEQVCTARTSWKLIFSIHPDLNSNLDYFIFTTIVILLFHYMFILTHNLELSVPV